MNQKQTGSKHTLWRFLSLLFLPLVPFTTCLFFFSFSSSFLSYPSPFPLFVLFILREYFLQCFLFLTVFVLVFSCTLDKFLDPPVSCFPGLTNLSSRTTFPVLVLSMFLFPSSPFFSSSFFSFPFSPILPSSSPLLYFLHFAILTCFTQKFLSESQASYPLAITGEK